MECSTRLERWEGQAGAREYWFSAREVGHALALVAAGKSYRQAAWAARRAAGRTHEPLTGRRGRRRDPNLDGQLVANWVDSLAAIVTAGELPERWPRRLALDSREFRIDGGPRAGQSFHVFAAVGHDEPGRPRVWRLAAFARRTEADWQRFLALCGGTPRLVVGDFDKALRKALAGAFPRAGERAPELRLCVSCICAAASRKRSRRSKASPNIRSRAHSGRLSLTTRTGRASRPKLEPATKTPARRCPGSSAGLTTTASWSPSSSKRARR